MVAIYVPNITTKNESPRSNDMSMLTKWAGRPVGTLESGQEPFGASDV